MDQPPWGVLRAHAQLVILEQPRGPLPRAVAPKRVATRRASSPGFREDESRMPRRWHYRAGFSFLIRCERRHLPKVSRSTAAIRPSGRARVTTVAITPTATSPIPSLSGTSRTRAAAGRSRCRKAGMTASLSYMRRGIFLR